jgi:hypothetical protein
MRQHARSEALVALLAVALALAPAAGAHVRKAAGPYELKLGWRDEPAFSGSPNAVELEVAAAGEPIGDARAALRVELRFGDVRRELALRPVAARAGVFAAPVVPTRPGVYALRVDGRLRGRAIGVGATCSERTFDCVRGAGAIQFPVAEPAAGELSAKLDRALIRAQRAGDRADKAQTLAGSALAAAVLALLAAVGVGVRLVRRT